MPRQAGSRLSSQTLGVMRSILFLFLSLLANAAHADAFYKLVGYKCDRQSDRLVLTYDAAANGAGQTMLEEKTETQWDPWTLIQMNSEGKVESTNTVRKTCKLSHGLYSIELGPIPGSPNTEGRCGAWISAWAQVRRGKNVIYPRTDFESGVGCFYANGEITTRVEIGPDRGRHKITKHPAEQLLSDTTPLR